MWTAVRWRRGTMPSRLPRCACGCGRRVKRPTCQYASLECVPSAVRAAGARQSRRVYAFRQRAKLFARELLAIRSNGHVITTDALLAAFKRIHRASYVAGFQAGRDGARPVSLEMDNPATTERL